MTKTKDELEEAADNWSILVSRERYVCEACGCGIPYDERDSYFASGMCAVCRDRQGKPD